MSNIFIRMDWQWERSKTLGFVSRSASGGFTQFIWWLRHCCYCNQNSENLHLLVCVRSRRNDKCLIKVVILVHDIKYCWEYEDTLLWYGSWVIEFIVHCMVKEIHVALISVSEKNLEALTSNQESIAWICAIVISFSVPEIATFLRSARLCFFKSFRSFKLYEFGLVCFIEISYVIGLSFLAFKVLPEIDVIQGAMLTNCFCLIPGILGSFQFSTFFVKEFKLNLNS